MRLVPEPPPYVAGPLERVLARAADSVGVEPEVILVEGERPEWLLAASALAPNRRGRAVVAARTEAGLLAAVRLGISGALWLPPSTVTAAAALRRVAEARPVRGPDPALAELMASAGDLHLVVVANAAFWRCQLGDALLWSCLAGLATELERPPALVPGPGLVVAGCDDESIRKGWLAVTGRRGFATEGVRALPIPGPVGHYGVTMAAMGAILGAGEVESTPSLLPPQPVCELPSGRTVGWWSARPGRAAPRSEWQAWPETVNEVGFEWRWLMPDGPEATVGDAVRADDAALPAVRLPGWVSVAALPGSPAGLLAERMAVAAQRAGCALWLPEVTTAALHFVLSLPGQVWVDGPAVPATAARVDSPLHSP